MSKELKALLSLPVLFLRDSSDELFLRDASDVYSDVDGVGNGVEDDVAADKESCDDEDTEEEEDEESKDKEDLCFQTFRVERRRFVLFPFVPGCP